MFRSTKAGFLSSKQRVGEDKQGIKVQKKGFGVQKLGLYVQKHWFEVQNLGLCVRVLVCKTRVLARKRTMESGDQLLYLST